MESSQSVTESERKLETHELWEGEKWWRLELPDRKHKAPSVSPALSRKRVPSGLLGHAQQPDHEDGPLSDLTS